MEEQERELQMPSFTLYPLTTQDLKTCYESERYKIICSLNGPYFQRKYSQLSPLFHVSISSSSSAVQGKLTPEHLIRLAKKMQQVLENVMLAGKYQRMVFDINVEIIESHPFNPPSFLLAPLINLLSYTCALRCLETISSFACSAVILRGQKICWELSSSGPEQSDRILVLCNDGRDRRVLLVQFTGEFNYVQFEKLSSVAEQSNQECLRFQCEKVGEVFQLFHQS